jgi:hypothetical protein
MHQKLRHQVKIHKISIEKKKKSTTKTCYTGKEKNLVQAYKVRANLTLGRDV